MCRSWVMPAVRRGGRRSVGSVVAANDLSGGDWVE